MCCCNDGGRECCSPIIPPSGKAKNWRIGLWIIVALHCIVLGLKMYLMGVFSALTDLFAITILVIAIVRFDYCQIMIYIVANLFEIFALVVVLGYYLQTDMGKNVPKKENGEKPPPPTDDEEESTTVHNTGGNSK
jgi:hypothetical protein